MKVDRVEAFVLKIPRHYRFGGQRQTPPTFPGGEYYFEKEWGEVYATLTQGLLVRVSAEGLYGWGECQAPIAPEVAAALIDRLLGPMLIGTEITDVEAVWDRMYRSMSVRGHTSGFMLDAIAGLDMALWDLKGKAAGVSVSALLGGQLRDHLPAYVSGLVGGSFDEQLDYAREHVDGGFVGVKYFMGRGVGVDLADCERIRRAIGDDARLFTDCLWKYSVDEATELGKQLEALDAGWIETPLEPEDLNGHVKLAQRLQLPVAAGEALRTRFQFGAWLGAGALDVVQPDIARMGITEGRRIARLAAEADRPVAFHLGLSQGVSMAATWQLASATPNFLVQEHHSPMLDISNEFMRPSLGSDKDGLIVPAGSGLGVDVDVNSLSTFVARRIDVGSR